MSESHLKLAQQIAAEFSHLPGVVAIALGGSSTSQNSDISSDIDLYVYTQQEIPLSSRHEIMEKTGGALIANIGLNYWGPGDEWIHLPTGIEVDMVYFSAAWMVEQIDQVLVQHRASMGYSTCFWYTLMNSMVLYDPQGWFARLQGRGAFAYPEELRSAIVELNHPVLRQIIPAYANQIKKAVHRSDLVSVNHRLAALLASYFDILFAVNRQLHPGEKRLVQKALQNCVSLPDQFAADMAAIFEISSANLEELPPRLDQLLDHMDTWLEVQGFPILPSSD
jgi:predicted nucleotidyltransferase